ncbi:hypothetical protein M407DRAFT_246265 [Tulasnella calospora MUT 4182]|uniref:Thioredoxin n=1 Tax=Tulasnella calospora MUT 4182 TaxID=1051891 RepID=A0A0C3Q602_9AGAM|nr:hypothetical protein M407DRAFT_246265 [Tulasnella calospora MUT 4182]
MVQYIKDLDDFRSKTSGTKPVIIDFTAAWCPPCKMIGPIFEGLSTQEENAGVEFYKVDVDEAADVAQECGIRAMPTFKVFRDGKEVDSMRGADVDGLQELVSKYKA